MVSFFLSSRLISWNNRNHRLLTKILSSVGMPDPMDQSCDYSRVLQETHEEFLLPRYQLLLTLLALTCAPWYRSEVGSEMRNTLQGVFSDILKNYSESYFKNFSHEEEKFPSLSWGHQIWFLMNDLSLDLRWYLSAIVDTLDYRLFLKSLIPALRQEYQKHMLVVFHGPDLSLENLESSVESLCAQHSSLLSPPEKPSSLTLIRNTFERILDGEEPVFKRPRSEEDKINPQYWNKYLYRGRKVYSAIHSKTGSNGRRVSSNQEQALKRKAVLTSFRRSVADIICMNIFPGL